MSKIPTERHGKLPRPSQTYFDGNNQAKILKTTPAQIYMEPREITQNKTNEEATKKPFASLIPKMNVNLEKVTEHTANPRIMDLREKLNEITRNKSKSVDKETKGLINDITQQLVDEKEDGSGPYSLIFELQSDPSTSTLSGVESLRRSQKYVSSKSADRLPSVLNFDDKPMKEFEYSCDKKFDSVKQLFNTHSRSDLCLQLKSHRPFESNLSPNDNTNSRANEENSLDDSLGILTPDQMDDMCYLDNAFSPTVESLPVFCQRENKASPDNAESPSTEKTESNSAASTIHNQDFDTVDKENITVTNDGIKLIESSFPQAEIVIISAPCISSNNEFSGNGEIVVMPNVEGGLTLDEEFLSSIHSSILEPVSSMADTTVNLDTPLEIQLSKDTRIVVNRIEQTPSPEDLPLDTSEINGEISTYSQLSASTLHDSQTYSDSKIDNPKSMETSKVSNSFVTSITSITSLDGYQGDGEMSRPVSRGAEHSINHREDAIEMNWQNVPVNRRVDPMTDSDFFTESDADGLDDHVQKGDRKAQVIDGALYGGNNGNGNPPLIVNRNEDSCMDSSGVYTDFENRASPVFLNAIEDMSPAGSTPSTRSECSQKNGRPGKLESYFDNLNNKDKKAGGSRITEEKSKNAIKRNSVNSDKDLRNVVNCKEEKRFTLKKYKMPKRDVPSKLKSMLASKTENSVQSRPKTLKKVDRRETFIKKNSLDLKSDHKAKSFKDVKSKVDCSQCSLSLQRSQTSCSVNRMPSSKSTNMNNKPNSRHMRMRSELTSAAGSGKSSLHSSQSDLSATSTPPGKPSARPAISNGKKRDGPPAPAPRVPISTPQPPPLSQVPAKKNGVVQKLSASPVSIRSRTSLAAPSSPLTRKPTPHRTTTQRTSTLPTNKEPSRVSAAVGPRGKRAATPQPPRTQPAAPLPLVPRDQSAALAHAAKGVEALGVLVQYLVFRLDALNGDSWRLEAERWRGVAAAERSTAARSDLDRQQRAQKDLDTIAECLSKISELEMEVSTKEEASARLQSAHVEEVSALANDIKELKGTIESLKHEVAESRARLHAHSEIERTLRAQLEAVRLELEAKSKRNGIDIEDASTITDDYGDNMIKRNWDTYRTDAYDIKRNGENKIDAYDIERNGEYKKYNKRECETCDAACDPVRCEAEIELRLANNEELSTDAAELAAEVRSLRAVIELKQAEIASLRDARSELAIEREKRDAAERDARAAGHAAEELKERAAARQREADRLKEDNRRLRDAANRDRDHASRISALNEELRYKLRQKSQVVSLLASGGYMERSLRARTSSGDSARSQSPPPDSPPSPASSPAPDTPPPLPAVKGVVEKHDSVSWVLEIEESPEEVATRLARKSSFRTATSSPGGVKRRGGGSPGNGSPAPASPAPNASKLFRPGDLDFPPPPPPLKESAGEAIYIYDDHRY